MIKEKELFQIYKTLKFAIDENCFDGENKAEAIEEIGTIIEEIRHDPNRAILQLSNLIGQYEQELLDEGKCPLCGTELTWESEVELVCAPFGNGYVEMDVGKRVCPYCGHRVDD